MQHEVGGGRQWLEILRRLWGEGFPVQDHILKKNQNRLFGIRMVGDTGNEGSSNSNGGGNLVASTRDS